jgi:SPOR domain
VPVSSDHPDHDEHEIYEYEPPRSIFAATWFRGLLVLIVLGVAGALAIPYVLDMMHQAPRPSAVATPSPGAPTGSSPAPIPPTSPPPPSASTTTPSTPVAPAPPPSAQAPEAKTAPRAPAKAVAEPSTRKGQAKTPAKRADVAKAVEPPAKVAEAPPKAAETPVTDNSGDTKSAAAANKAPARVAAKVTPEPTKPATAVQYWVQVGAFRDESTAKRLVARLQEQNFKAQESVKAVVDPPLNTGTTSMDRYDVLVSGVAAAELNNRLSGKGLTAEPSSGVLVVRPSLPLRDAVALSKDLAVDGLKVQVRRIAGGEGAKPATRGGPAAGAGAGGETLHRVRVGGFADRDGATTALRDLEAKGYKGYIARGDR